MSRPNGDSPPRMRGATASVAGSRGAVPKPTAGQHNFMLLGDGTWGAQPIAGLPSQTSNSGKLLTTDGTNAAWSGVITVPAASNNVGIGTTSPTATGFSIGSPILDLTGTVPTLAFHTNGSTQQALIVNAGDGLILSASGAATASNNNVIRFFTEETNSQNTPTERVRIDSTGNVGVGVISPAQKLSVNGTTQWAQTDDPGYSGYLTNASTNAAYNPAITRNLIGSTGSTYTIAHGGMDAYAGIQFGISGTTTNAGNISFFAASGSFATNESVTPVARMFIANTGDVSISSTTAGSANVGALVIQGGISAGNTGSAASYFGGAVTTGGSATIGGTTVSIQAAGGGASNLDFLGNTGSPVNAKIQYDQVATTSGQLFFQTANAGSLTTKLTLSNTGAATFAGPVTVSGGSALVQSGTADPFIHIKATANAYNPYVHFEAWDRSFYMGVRDTGGDGLFSIANNSALTTPILSLNPASPFTATFAGAVSITGDIGFYGQAATAKPTGVAVTAAAIHAALVTLNLIAA